MLKTLFLRLYGFNLGRQSRNSRDKAFADAIYQTSFLLMLPVGTLIGWIGDQFPALLQDDKMGLCSMALGGLIALPGFSWIESTMASYKRNPHEAEPFRSPRQRSVTATLYFG